MYVLSAEHLNPLFSLDDDVEHNTSSSDSEMDIEETHQQSMSKEQEERTVSHGQSRGVLANKNTYL